MCNVRPLFDIKYGQGRVGQRLAKDRLGVGLEQLLDVGLVRLGVGPDALDTELLERDTEQVDGAAIDGGGSDEAVASRAQVQDRQQGGSLAGRGQHGADAALERRDLLLDGVTGRVCKAGVHKLGGHIEQTGDMCGRVKAIGRGLHDGQGAGAAVLRLVALMQAFGFDFHESSLRTVKNRESYFIVTWE